MRNSSTVQRAGYGTRITRTPWGNVTNVPPSNGNFAHPFRAILTGQGVQFSKGIIFGTTLPYEPVITPATGGAAVPISGTTSATGQVTARPPVLALDPGVVTPNTTESWACVEFTPNADGTTDSKTVVQMVHRAGPFSNNAAVARTPIALIVWQGKTPGSIFQIAYFNMRYFFSTPPVGSGPRIYFFT